MARRGAQDQANLETQIDAHHMDTLKHNDACNVLGAINLMEHIVLLPLLGGRVLMFTFGPGVSLHLFHLLKLTDSWQVRVSFHHQLMNSVW